MRLLFDANVPKQLRRLLPGHKISTAQEQGWGRVSNGALLTAAESAGFDAMITADKNIAYQQNLAAREIALIVLPTNNWSLLKPAVPQIAATVEAAIPNSFQMLELGR